MHCLLNLRCVSRRMSSKHSPLPLSFIASIKPRNVVYFFMMTDAVLLLTPGMLHSMISPMFCGVMFSHFTCFTLSAPQ